MDKLVKPWRNRSKIVSNTGTALWTPKGDFRWCSAGGQSVVLTETNLSALSNSERRALQRLALLKLQTLSIQCTIPTNKGEVKNFGKRLRRSLRSRKRMNADSLGSALLGKFSAGKARTAVFATPLDEVIKKDRLHAAGVSQVSRQTRRKSEPTTLSTEAREKHPRRRRASSNTPPATSALKRQQMKHSKSSGALQKNSASTSSLRSAGSSVDGDFSKPKRHSDSDSILISDLHPEQKRIGWKSQLLDALTLSSTSASASCLLEKPELPIPSPPKVPSIVLKSIEYLEKHGLHALGIFRVAGSKKRLKQLRDEFDNGLRENFSEEDNPHEVAALFKEFLRCLPEPLMTRELYTAFLSTQRFKDTDTQLSALKYLWYLLPDSNRDTLQSLLCFLSKVAKFAEDTTDENDQIVPGNKMNCRNLATLMGPNILHKVKSAHLQNFVVESMHRAEEHDEVIDVTEDLINAHDKLSTVSPEMHDQVMRFLLQTEPETVDFILRRRVQNHRGEDIENIIKGSSDIISEIDDQETNARLQHRNTSRKGTSRANGAPASNKHFNSTECVQTVDSHLHSRCASADAQFKTFGLSSCNCSCAQAERRMRKQRSYPCSEPATPKMNTSVSFTYFPPSPNLGTMSTGNSLNVRLSHSPTEVTYPICRLESNCTENGNSVSTDGTSFIAESRGESDITSDDFDDMDMKKRWLEWEALSKNFKYDADFLDQETLV